MCGTCGCRDAESFEAPFFEMDGFCLSCGGDEVAYDSNICKECQIKLGIKKLGEFRAETFAVDVIPQFNEDGTIKNDEFMCGECKTVYDDSSDATICCKCPYCDEAIHEGECIKNAETFEAPTEFSTQYLEQKAANLYKKKTGKRPHASNIKSFLEYLSALNDKDYNELRMMYKKLGESNLSNAKSYHKMYLGMEKREAESFEAQSRKTGEICGNKGCKGNLLETEYGGSLSKLHCDKCNYSEVMEWEAESFEAQRKLTDVDRDGKPYTGQIYPDHPNLDPVKADRNNDGYMSSWERALGNQVAMGMERGGYSAEFFESESTGSRFPWKTLIAVAVGVFAVSRIKNVEFKAERGCGCGCSGGGGCGDKKSAEGYPEVYDPVADFLPRYRYPADSVWSNDYNPADPYRPLDYQTVHTDSNTKAKRM